jgi:hypothetical protein
VKMRTKSAAGRQQRASARAADIAPTITELQAAAVAKVSRLSWRPLFQAKRPQWGGI